MSLKYWLANDGSYQWGSKSRASDGEENSNERETHIVRIYL